MESILGFILSCACVFMVPVMLWLVASESGRKRRSDALLDYASQIAAHDRALDMSAIDTMDGHAFEQYVARLLLNEGYSDVEVTRGSGDFGVDIVAHRDDARVAIQVKRHASNVSRHAVSDAVAGMRHYGCTEAMVVTNSHFSKAATEFADSVGCELIDRDVLCGWIARFQSS